MKFGDFELFLIEDGAYCADGGVLFGALPKVIWQKPMPTDERNRVDLASNLLLVRRGSENLLVDTGLGGKWEDLDTETYGISEPRTMVTDLARVDLLRKEITHVALTHLHAMSNGGTTYIDQEGELHVQFPRAKHFVQKAEWDVANNPLSRDKWLYRPENLLPLEEAGVMEFVEGTVEIIHGVTMKRAGGHTAGHAVVFVESGNFRAAYCGDLIPTTHHVHKDRGGALDLFPEEAIRFRQEFLAEAYEKHILLLFPRDPNVPAGHLVRNEWGDFSVEPLDMELDEYPVPSTAKSEDPACR